MKWHLDKFPSQYLDFALYALFRLCSILMYLFIYLFIRHWRYIILETERVYK